MSRFHPPRPLPGRIYEPNIIHNPFTWMGIWTPQGWRIHKKRWGSAERYTVTLSGDGKTTFFPEALLDPQLGRTTWQDDLHLKDDPFTDSGIYPSDPRVEYPVGRPRWAVSHTLLCYPVADHGLYTHEYTWDLVHGHLYTHFRHHVALEEATTDSYDGMTVQVKHTPISNTIEGNVQYPLCNSAVRGVWSSPDKGGTNFYAKRRVQAISMLNGSYAYAPKTPVLQCHGLYGDLPSEALGDARLFDPESGVCLDWEQLTDRLHIPLDEPKLGWFQAKYQEMESTIYEGKIGVATESVRTVDQTHVEAARERLGAKCEFGKVGYSFEQAVNSDTQGYRGYVPDFDLDGDGVISEQDVERLASHVGRKARLNLYKDAYFGGDWLSSSWCTEVEHRPGVEVVADFDYGGGYNSTTGVIHLLETPGPNQKVYVEYHYDAPAEAGSDNIVLHLYRERS